MSLISDLWNELQSIPKPATEEQVLAIAKEFARKANKDFRQFEAWFETEKSHVLAMLNSST